MKTVIRRTSILASVGALLLGIVSTPVGAESQRITDAEFNAIMRQAWSTGKVTAAQRAAIMSRPDLAATTVDPTSATPDYLTPGYIADPTEVPPGAKSADGAGQATRLASAYATRTTSRDRYVSYTNWVGTILMHYHFVVAWSYNGSIVTAKPTAYSYIAKCNSCRNSGIVGNDTYPNYSGSRIYAYTVPLRGKGQYCAATGCEDPVYPQVRFGVYYDGTYNYTFLSSGG